MLISSPTNFFANDGMPCAAWTWSMVTSMPLSSESIDTIARLAPWNSQTSSRKDGSASISATSGIGAS